MTQNEQTQTQPAAAPDDSNKEQGQAPYESVVSQVVTKIKNEPFLFVIAIVALLIGLVLQATELASPDLRFLIIVFAFLAFVAILGYYILEGWKLYSKTQQQESEMPKEPEPPQSTHPVQKITGKAEADHIEGKAKVKGAIVTEEALNFPGQISGEAKAGIAKEESQVIGVEFSSDDDPDKPNSDNSS